jgi:hypothetical protein
MSGFTSFSKMRSITSALKAKIEGVAPVVLDQPIILEGDTL